MANPQDFADKITAVDAATVTSAAWNAMMEGLQAEYEDRMEATTVNGVWSGMACSIVGTTIAVASGEAYVEGKRYAGTGSVEFAGKAADTYYIYIDPSDDTTPYKAKTTVPSSGQLSLGQVVWSGAALSALVTGYQQIGLVQWQHSTFCSGSINSTNYPTSSIVDFVIVDRNIWLETVKIVLRSTPTGSAVIVDVHAGAALSEPSTVWTTTSYRPTFLTTYTDYQVVEATGYIMANRSLTAGNIITVKIDQVDSSTGAADLSILLYGRYT